MGHFVSHAGIFPHLPPMVLRSVQVPQVEPWSTLGCLQAYHDVHVRNMYTADNHLRSGLCDNQVSVWVYLRPRIRSYAHSIRTVERKITQRHNTSLSLLVIRVEFGNGKPFRRTLLLDLPLEVYVGKTRLVPNGLLQSMGYRLVHRSHIHATCDDLHAE